MNVNVRKWGKNFKDSLLEPKSCFADEHPTSISLFSPEKIETPETINLKFDSAFAHLQGEFYSSPSGNACILRNVLYSPLHELLFFATGQIILECHYSHTLLHEYLKRLNIKSLFLRKFQRVSGYSCCFRRPGDKAFYHNLIDEIPRASLLSHPYFSEIEQISLLCGTPQTDPECLLLPQLLPSNVTITPLDKRYIYSLDKLILLPYRTRRGSGYLPSDYLEKIPQILPNRDRSRRNKIFISRQSYVNKKGKRHILNQEDLDVALTKRGFIKIMPEKIPLRQSIELFFDAQIILGAMGSGMSHILWSEKATVIELHNVRRIHPHFYYLSKCLDHRYFYWLSKIVDDEPADTWQSCYRNFTVDINQVQELIDLAVAS